MSREGPPLEILMRRLVDCPPDFLAEPWLGGKGRIHVEAVVADLLRDWGMNPIPDAWLKPAAQSSKPEEKSRLRLLLLAAWLLHEPWFQAHASIAEAAADWLPAGLNELSKLVPAEKFMSDPERREELARQVLAGLGLRPAGESEAQAQDRLATLNSLERQSLLRAARAAEERSRALREALAKKAAQEAADKWNRE